MSKWIKVKAVEINGKEYMQAKSGHIWSDGWHSPESFDLESAGPFDTTLTPYPEMDNEYPTGVFAQSGVLETGKFETRGWGVRSTADLDARDHFASEVRDLHPTQFDRIEKRLNEIERQLGIRGV